MHCQLCYGPSAEGAPAPHVRGGHYYFVSLCSVCLPQNLQYFFSSILSGVVRLFLVVV